MRPVVELVGSEALDSLTSPSNLRLGNALEIAGEVELVDSDAHHIQGRVGGGASRSQRRRVELWTDEKLRWSCSCTSDPRLFCKHLAAAALSAQKTAGKS